MMKSPLPIAAALVSLVALAGCNSQSEQPQVIDTNPDPMASTLANAAPVELPPAIKAAFLTALDSTPARRFQTAHEFQRALA